jgi:hypothetical protein
MAQNNSHITPDNFTEWMASTGFMFPRTILELERFEKLYDDIRMDLSGRQIDPEIILGRKAKPITAALKPLTEENDFSSYRMVARKGDSPVPKHILDKMKRNQEKRKENDGSGPEKEKPE